MMPICSKFSLDDFMHLPWYARVLAALIVTYALSYIDLIPDVIPLIGYLDSCSTVKVQRHGFS